MLFTNNLNVVWFHMGTDLSCLEEVDSAYVFRNVKLPLSIDIVSDAMHRLISLDNEWVNIRE